MVIGERRVSNKSSGETKKIYYNNNKKTNVTHNYNNHLYIHRYYRKCLYLHIYTLTDMRSFEAKLCKFHYFSIYKHLCECYHIAKEGKLYEKLGHIAMWTRGHVSTLEHMSVS